MNFYTWLLSFSSTSFLLAILLWLSKSWIITKLTKSVQHDYDKKLENLRAQLRETEEKLKADLRIKEGEISALRSGALSAMISQQAVLDKRRLEAVDQLWASYNSFNSARWITAILKVIKFDEAAIGVKADPKAREMFKSMAAGFDAKSIDNSSAAKARPFVSVMVWATYTAYTAICYHAIMRWQLLITGLGDLKLIDNAATEKLVLVALPEYADYFKKFGPDSYAFVLEVLEAKLLDEIKIMLNGKEADQAAVHRASEILKASQLAMEKINKTDTTLSTLG